MTAGPDPAVIFLEREELERIIIHVDMDAFYASVEIRDDPSLRGKPLIIGSLPQERGVVATCSYEARKYGVRSGMNIKEAYRLCPGGLYLHPNFEKYRAVSQQLRAIWNSYATASETVALDEAYLDVSETAGSWAGACAFAREIKRRTREELQLSCSVGVAYCKAAAKTASEEKKPDGYFEIPDAKAFIDLIIDRDVRVLQFVGDKTAEKLRMAGIRTVRDVREQQETVIRLLGKHGAWITQLANGIDERPVTAYKPEDAKSVSREVTFQEDAEDLGFLKDVLFLLSLSVESRAERVGLYGRGVTLKVTYADMKTVTRSRMIKSSRSAAVLYRETSELLEQLERRPVRLIGAGFHSLEGEEGRQLRLEEVFGKEKTERDAFVEKRLSGMEARYHLGFSEELTGRGHSADLYRLIETMRTLAGEA